MATSQKDVFGISSLTNPNYSSSQAGSVEHSFIHGTSLDAKATTAEPDANITPADLLQKRMEEIEKNVGCPIFNPQTTLPAPQMQARGSGGGSSFDEPDFSDFAAHAASASSQSAYRDPAASATMSGGAGIGASGYRPISMSVEGIQHTEEAQKRDRLASALSVLSIDAADGFLDADRERDRKLEMIEEIEDLVALFKDDGEDVSKIHIPTVDEPSETIQCTLKILKRHNDRRRFGNLADDCIMLAATSLETICDGERDLFGFRPDLRGWSNHVRAKLRRMHHDTSQIASSIMNDYNIGPGMRLVIELIPNLIMYARNKSLKQAGDEKGAGGDDPEFASAVENLRGR